MLDNILNRRSTRRFTDQPVSDTHLELLLRAAMQAPSAKNEQPWEFLVIRKRETLLALSQADPYAGAVKNATTAIVLLCRMDACGETEGVTFWQQDMAAAAENILLAAQELGLGAVWLALAPVRSRMDYVQTLLHLPEKLVPFAMIPLGCPVQWKAPDNRYDSRRVHYETAFPAEGCETSGTA